MNESKLRVFLVFFGGAAVGGLIQVLLEKVLSMSKLRRALLSGLITGACIYIALRIDSVLPK
jgi:hypothetical protein